MELGTGREMTWLYLLTPFPDLSNSLTPFPQGLGCEADWFVIFLHLERVGWRCHEEINVSVSHLKNGELLTPLGGRSRRGLGETMLHVLQSRISTEEPPY